MTATAAQIKRYIQPGGMLALAEHDGTLWATNRYWLTRAGHVEPFLTKHDIKGPGVWRVDGRDIWHDAATPPRVELFLNIDDYMVPLTQVSVGDFDQAYALGPDGYCALFSAPDGRHVGVLADWLDWLEEAPAPTADDVVYEMRLAITERRPGPVAIIAEPVAPEPGEDSSPQLVAVVMPVRADTPEAGAEAEAEAGANIIQLNNN